MHEPGTVVTNFVTKSGKQALIRSPKPDDASVLLEFINSISLEDTFIRFSGEQQTLADEQKYLSSELEAIDKGNAVKLFCFVEGKFAGVCDIHRDESLASRRLHIGVLGLIVAKNFRGEGVGKELMQVTISQAQKHIKGLRMVKLDCFASNTAALGLYHKMGFVEVGRIPGALMRKGELDDEIIMVRELAS